MSDGAMAEEDQRLERFQREMEESRRRGFPEGVSGPEQGAAGGEPKSPDLRVIYNALHGAMEEKAAWVWRYEVILKLLAEVERLRAALRSAPPGRQT